MSPQHRGLGEAHRTWPTPGYYQGKKYLGNSEGKFLKKSSVEWDLAVRARCKRMGLGGSGLTHTRLASLSSNSLLSKCPAGRLGTGWFLIGGSVCWRERNSLCTQTQPETTPPAHVHLCCSFETSPLFSSRGRVLPISLPVHPRWKVTAHGTQPGSLILLAPPNSLCPKALKLQTLPCSLPGLPRCEIQHLPLS